MYFNLKVHIVSKGGGQCCVFNWNMHLILDWFIITALVLFVSCSWCYTLSTHVKYHI